MLKALNSQFKISEVRDRKIERMKVSKRVKERERVSELLSTGYMFTFQMATIGAWNSISVSHVDGGAQARGPPLISWGKLAGCWIINRVVRISTGILVGIFGIPRGLTYYTTNNDLFLWKDALYIHSCYTHATIVNMLEYFCF